MIIAIPVVLCWVAQVAATSTVDSNWNLMRNRHSNKRSLEKCVSVGGGCLTGWLVGCSQQLEQGPVGWLWKAACAWYKFIIPVSAALGVLVLLVLPSLMPSVGGQMSIILYIILLLLNRCEELIMNIWINWVTPHFPLLYLAQFVYLGIVTSIENNHKQVDSARKGQEVCIKIENVPGETPKLYGRHFDETDMLISKVSVEFTREWIHSGGGCARQTRWRVDGSLGSFVNSQTDGFALNLAEPDSNWVRDGPMRRSAAAERP